MPVVCILDRGCNRDLTYSGSSVTTGITIVPKTATNPRGESGNGSPILDVRGKPISHGTLCAGVLARTYSVNGGVAGSLQIMSVAFQDDMGPHSADEIARGIKWATDHGARIISMSQTFTPTNFGSADATLINTAIQYAIDHNVIICAATGNQNQAAIHYPANQLGVIAVGACESNGQRVMSEPIPGGSGTWGSNYGPQMSVVALGVEVATGLGSPLNTFYGTSSAAPQVAALAALILSINPQLTNVQVRRIIEHTADKVGSPPSDPYVAGWNQHMGYGPIDVLAALTLASKTVNAPLALSANRVAENAATGTPVGTVSATDPDVGETLTYSLTDSAGGRFAINSLTGTLTGALTVANGSLLDFETATSHTITVRVTDNGGLTFDKSFTITVTNVNEAPTALVLSGSSVTENAATGTPVGTVSATDPDVGETLTYSLTDSAGGRFAINSLTGALTVANGSLLDFEVATSHTITVRVTDSGGLTFDQNFTITVTEAPNDPLFYRQWNMTRIKAGGSGQTGWDISIGDPSIVVCVLDRGCQLDHPDLQVSGSITLNGSTPSGNGSPIASSGHGTNCAGVVAARYNNGLGVAGVAGNCRIMSVALQNFTDEEIAAGINWAADNGARVINISRQFRPVFSQTSKDKIDAAIAYALGQGVVLCIAAGNSNGAIQYPATHQNVIAVGASDQADNRPAASNFGPNISVVAPGVAITTTGINSGYVTNFLGTGAATPHVAGLAALILSVNPSLTNVRVRNIIERTADKVGGYNYANTPGHPNGTWNIEMGYGRINVLKALTLAKTTVNPGGDTTPPAAPTGLIIR